MSEHKKAQDLKLGNIVRVCGSAFFSAVVVEIEEPNPRDNNLGFVWFFRPYVRIGEVDPDGKKATPYLATERFCVYRTSERTYEVVGDALQI